MMTRSVAIIGAGPSGLVTAKTLTASGSLSVTVFDRQPRVGGLWAVSPGEENKALNPNMPTNLSKFTVCFSDLAWSSVDVTFEGKKGFVGMFPKAWQAGRYLEEYARRFVPEGVLKLGCEVMDVKMSQSEGAAEKRWRVSWKEETGAVQQKEFSHLVIAAGFFAAPRPCDILNDSRSKIPLTIKPVHSSRARSLLRDVVPQDWDGTGDIIVVGGSMSGAEAATSLALQLSDLRHSPGRKSSLAASTSKVIHVVPRPFYALPPFIKAQSDSKEPAFLPADVCFYDLQRRKQDPICASSGMVPPEKARLSHGYMRSLVGDQRDVGSDALVAESVDEPAYVALTAGGMYTEFVRSGAIKPVRGRVTHFSSGDGANRVTAQIKSSSANDTDSLIKNIAGIVYATGYTPFPSLSYLSPNLHQSLELDTSSHRLPAILADIQTSHPSLPTLGFVGFYEGPYWGVAEMQARLLARMWSEDEAFKQTSKTDEDLEAQRRLRTAISSRATAVPQYWNGDYIGLMASLAADLKMNDALPPRSGIVTPARYSSPTSSSHIAKDENAKSLAALSSLLSTPQSYASLAAFRALHGAWSLRRSIKSALPSFPSGSFVGMASFHPRFPTAVGFDAEYLYVESGTLTMAGSGAQMSATRRYVYRYSEEAEQMSVWFVKEDGGSVDYRFLALEAVETLNSDARGDESEGKESADGRSVCSAKGWHDCAPDAYDARYDWHFLRSGLERMRVVYVVKGPRKDYVSETWFER